MTCTAAQREVKQRENTKEKEKDIEKKMKHTTYNQCSRIRGQRDGRRDTGG